MRQPYALRTAGAHFYARDLEFIPAVKREPGYAGTFCWNQGYDRAPQPAPPAPSGKYYQNCQAVWNDLGRLIRRGEPEYGLHLDRDNDGVGCERRPNY